MKARKTEKKVIYTVRHYKLVNLLVSHKKDCYDYYHKVEKAHPGCYKLEWELKFSSEKKLKQQLKIWYPKEKSVFFYTNLNSALRENSPIYNYQCIISHSGIAHDRIGFSLKKPRKRCKKRRSWQWDDMWYSDDEVYTRKVMDKDQLIIDLADIHDNYG